MFDETTEHAGAPQVGKGRRITLVRAALAIMGGLLMLTTVLAFIYLSAALDSGPALPLRRLQQDVISGMKQELYAIITTQAEWQALWDVHSPGYIPRPPQPSVDFSKEFVVAAFWGGQPCLNYSLDIDAVRVKQHTITVQVHRHGPGPEGFCLTAIGYPHEVVAVPIAGLTPGAYNVVFTGKDDMFPNQDVFAGTGVMVLKHSTITVP